MSNLTVAVIGDIGYSKNLGKIGTTSDITFYNLKQGDSIVTMIEPTRYPEKFSSLFYSVSLCDFVIFIVKDIDHLFGEMVVTLDTLNKNNGCFILKNYYSEDDVTRLVNNTTLSNYPFFSDNTTELREMLVEKAKINQEKYENTTNTKGTVVIDHFFNVKGIGTVVLGFIVSGMVKRHDKMRLLPLEREAQIRSIQKHDEDFNIATKGDRVGLALKNVEVEDLDRGYILSSEDDLTPFKDLDVRLKKNFFWNKELKEEDVIHVGHWMQFIPARVTNVKRRDNNADLLLKLSLDKAVVLRKNSKILLSNLNNDKLRVIGSATINY